MAVVWRNLSDMSRQPNRWLRITGAVALALGVGFAPQVRATEAVDVELVLAVDVSLSMSPGELEIQRHGYAAALTDKDVLDAIASGLHGRIAITYFEWAGNTMQHVVVPWTVVASEADARAVATRLTSMPPNSARRTSISGALGFAGDLFAESSFEGMKRVIDVSGDGPNNQGAPVTEIRDALVKQGITINGLPLMTSGAVDSGYDVKDLDVYYTKCVVGGPGAFVVPVNGWSQFPEAVRRKLVLELAATQPKAIPVQLSPSDQPPTLLRPDGSYDCLIGEKLWRNRFWMWNDAR